MDEVKIIEIKQSVFAANDKQAEQLRAELKEKGIFLLNLMSSPGSGKTTTLTRTIEALKGELKIGVMEADIDSDVDAKRIAATGAKAIQLHTGGMCHLDAGMTRQGLEALETADVELAILENVGNLVCPAEFDTGASRNAMILSVPEGEDKPLKYPLMFSVCDVVLINKIDVMPYFDFDLQKCKEYIHMRNPKAKIIPICAKTGEGIEQWADWLRAEVAAWKNEA
ncbi:MAG: hydrogenase nickel incorporation protein HypB [Clostridia bacterium]|nr:hydrogenase nickel incorporation protein HypB [Clostridia bacterium]